MRNKCIYYRGIFIVFCLFLWGTKAYCSGVIVDDNQKKLDQDSLLSVLRKATDVNVKLQSLYKLTRLTRETPAEVSYQKQLVQLAGDVDSMKYYYEALSSLGRYYCNRNKKDSLFYWGGILDSVTKVRKDTPDELFDFLNYYSI